MSHAIDPANVSALLEAKPSSPRQPPQGPGTGSLRTAAASRLLLDQFVRRTVKVGGILIIGSILAILVVILYEVFPLFRSLKSTPMPALSIRSGGAPLALAVDEYQEAAIVVREDGIAAVSLDDASPLPLEALDLSGATIASASEPRGGTVALGLSDGRVLPLQIEFTASYADSGRRTIAPHIQAAPSLTVLESAAPVELLTYVQGPDGPVTAVKNGPSSLLIVQATERRSLLGEVAREETRTTVQLAGDAGEITALAINGLAEDVFVGASSGKIVRIDLRKDAPQIDETASVSGKPITLLGFLIGGRTLIAGDTGGQVSSWHLIRNEATNTRHLTRIHDFESHAAPVAAFSPSVRNKGFFTADSFGNVHLHYGTSGKTLLKDKIDTSSLSALAYSPKGDGFFAVSREGKLFPFELDNRHPEISWQTLFGKVWYEGYQGPEYSWQSTGGTDDFESKLSLTPLIVGTLKGTFYALLFAVPLALLGALYTSQFMHPSLRATIKPAVEIMAALPSVVLGFIAGLWLAPMMEKVLPGVFLAFIGFPLMILAGLLLWQKAPDSLRRLAPQGREVFVLVPLVLLALAFSFGVGHLVESSLLGGDYRRWITSVLGFEYDQRNSIVVGIAMGFAVVPIIFTIAEDSLSNVPPNLAAGALALGGTRWQTAVRVVLPTASPGIFSAIMIGFGRAVGETMIVLMATGNTPVMNFSPFNGFRALSANIAVELPEAPEGSTHYRVLFLAALLLFVLTFLVNTAAEIIRLRLRRKYQAYA
ncbi:MAG: ABC transporter permease subunit [Bdellovibrionota bacterium]